MSSPTKRHELAFAGVWHRPTAYSPINRTLRWQSHAASAIRRSEHANVKGFPIRERNVFDLCRCLTEPLSRRGGQTYVDETIHELEIDIGGSAREKRNIKERGKYDFSHSIVYCAVHI
jgi:hypothetical protein